MEKPKMSVKEFDKLGKKDFENGDTLAEIRNALKDREELRDEIERLDRRDGNATITLCFNDGNNPFAREQLNILDFGVADNIYVVEKK